MKQATRAIGVCLVLIVLGALGVGWFQDRSLNSNTSATGSSTAKTSSSKTTHQPTYTVDDQALADIPTLLANNSDIDMSVSITDLQTGKTYHYGETNSFTAASIGKLVTSTAFLHMVEKGTATLDESVGGTTAQDELQKMIVNSDNDAWHNMEMLVTLDAQDDYAQSIGLTSYDADTNVITSSDIALLLTKLCSGKLLNDSNTQLLLAYMQQANYRQYIVAAIPPDVTVYHKVGVLDDRLHDAAIIKKGNRSYVLVIFSKTAGDYDFNRGATLFGTITRDTLQAFFGSTT